jgi:hypothetical protein
MVTRAFKYTSTESNCVTVTAFTGIGQGQSVQGGTIKQGYLANEHFRNDTQNTIFTNVDTTADINENNVSATTHIQEGDNIVFIKQILRHLSMTISMLNNKVDEVSGEITRLTKDIKRFRILFEHVKRNEGNITTNDAFFYHNN